jgi:hypothetical protein
MLRFEVLFKKFRPRINLATLFFTKLYLLNTIKPFLGQETWSLGPKLHNLKKPLLGGYPEPEFLNSENAGHQVGPNEARNQNFSFLGLMV